MPQAALPRRRITRTMPPLPAGGAGGAGGRAGGRARYKLWPACGAGPRSVRGTSPSPYGHRRTCACVQHGVKVEALHDIHDKAAAPAGGALVRLVARGPHAVVQALGQGRGQVGAGARCARVDRWGSLVGRETTAGKGGCAGMAGQWGPACVTAPPAPRRTWFEFSGGLNLGRRSGGGQPLGPGLGRRCDATS